MKREDKLFAHRHLRTALPDEHIGAADLVLILFVADATKVDPEVAKQRWREIRSGVVAIAANLDATP